MITLVKNTFLECTTIWKVSPNNLTTHRYSKITRYLAINRGRILALLNIELLLDLSNIRVGTLKIGFYNSCFERVQTGLVTIPSPKYQSKILMPNLFKMHS